MYRSLLQRDNQYYINFDKQEIIEEPGYLELTHHQINRRVAFVNLGVPDGSGKWFSCIELTKELHLVGTSEEDKQKNEISREQLVRFKNFAQGVHENGVRINVNRSFCPDKLKEVRIKRINNKRTIRENWVEDSSSSLQI